MATDDAWAVILVIVGPTSIVLIAGIVKGYRLTFRLDRPERTSRWRRNAPMVIEDLDTLQRRIRGADEMDSPRDDSI